MRLGRVARNAKNLDVFLGERFQVLVKGLVLLGTAGRVVLWVVEQDERHLF